MLKGLQYGRHVTKMLLSCTVSAVSTGIGYFTLPYLVHAGASFVHACEWNPHAVKALRRNLELNGAAQRCQVHQGDNRQVGESQPLITSAH